MCLGVLGLLLGLGGLGALGVLGLLGLLGLLLLGLLMVVIVVGCFALFRSRTLAREVEVLARDLGERLQGGQTLLRGRERQTHRLGGLHVRGRGLLERRQVG